MVWTPPYPIPWYGMGPVGMGYRVGYPISFRPLAGLLLWSGKRNLPLTHSLDVSLANPADQVCSVCLSVCLWYTPCWHGWFDKMAAYVVAMALFKHIPRGRDGARIDLTGIRLGSRWLFMVWLSLVCGSGKLAPRSRFVFVFVFIDRGDGTRCRP